MSETFYKRVNYPENKPEKGKTYDTNEGELKFDNEYGGEGYWQNERGDEQLGIEWFYKPLPILSRDMMIYKIENAYTGVTPYMAELIADTILKSGLPEKKVTMSKEENCCRNCSDGRMKYPYDNFCPSCGSKITWID